MKPEKFDELMKKYRVTKARIARLREDLRIGERNLRACSSSMVDDMISLSQAITGMPHGSGTGDPTGRLAIDIATGKVTPFVKQTQEDIAQINLELMILEPQARYVEIALGALSERERELVTMKIIDEFSWVEVIHQMNTKFGGNYTKRTLQRLVEHAMQKAYEVVR